MWIMTIDGFFSIVQKPEDVGQGCLTVRARVKADLERMLLHIENKPEDVVIEENTGSDYAYRVRVPIMAIGYYMLDRLLELNYSNFKDEVTKQFGFHRAHAYSDVWGALYGLTDDEKRSNKRKKSLS